MTGLSKRHVSPCRWSVFAALTLLTLSSGCASVWWNSFLDPSQVGNFHDHSLVSEIQRTISFRDTPGGVPGATDPVPDDLVQTVQEYEIGVSDQLSIRVLDLVERGAESEFQPVVDELGYIHIAQLGWIHAEGMTARELRAELIQRAHDAQIFRPEQEPTIIVSFLIQQARLYHIMGTITSPGRYRIQPPDFRLLEAINQAGGLDPNVKFIYVFRNAPKPRKVIDRGVRPTLPNMTAPPTESNNAPPVSPISLAEMAGGPAAPLPPPATPSTTTATEPARSPAQPPPPGDQPKMPTEQDLMEALAPPAGMSNSASAPATTSPEPGTAAPAAPKMAPFIFVNDKFIEAPAATTPPATGTPDNGPAPMDPDFAPPSPTAAGATSKPVDWQELAAEGQQRIIRIPADKLQNGDSNYNIVIQHNDLIRLDSGQVGVFYVMGHVMRPGVYSLTGQEITLKQAIAAAGGLDALAWPTRCEITRRIDGDREELTQWNLERIMAGTDPDVYLKPEDTINVGTHAIASLLATIRNSFRLTYGFGFVYDRNFADIDSYIGQQNPRDTRRVLLQQRFPGLF